MDENFVSEEVIDNGIVVDPDGKILHNVFQSEVNIVRRKDRDGKVHLTRQDNGAYILPAFDPNDFDWRLQCQHCGKAPW